MAVACCSDLGIPDPERSGKGDRDANAVAVEGSVGRLQQGDHGEALLTIRDRVVAGPHAADEMLALDLQWLLPGDEGNGNLPVPIRQLELAEGVRRRRLDPLVVDADLFRQRHVIVDGHLAIADHGDPADLGRIEPADVDLGAEPAVVLHLDISNVVHIGLHAGAPASAHRDRFAIEDIGQDRNVMGREIPDDVDLTLEQPEAQARRIDVVHATEFARLHDGFQSPDGGVVEEGVTGHQRHASGVRQRVEAHGVLQIGRQRLLHQDVLSRKDGVARDGVMRLDRSRHHHSLDVGLKQGTVVGIEADSRIPLLQVAQPVLSWLGNAGKDRLREVLKIAHQLWAPVPVADDPDPHRPVLQTCRTRRVVSIAIRADRHRGSLLKFSLPDWYGCGAKHTERAPFGPRTRLVEINALSRTCTTFDRTSRIDTIIVRIYGSVNESILMQGRGMAGYARRRHLSWPMPGGWARWFKRPVDLVLSISLLIVLAPLMALVAVVIRLDSPGPALFSQDRLGRDQRPFRMRKFRSMYAGNDDASHREAAANWFAAVPAPTGYKLRNDPRVTRVGRYLRRTNLDELPQLFNIIRGDMTLVGPRPAIGYELVHYSDWFYERFAVRPGVTGLWQVSGRDWVPADEMMRLDCEYVRRCSAWVDLKILALTLPALLGSARMRRAET